MPSSLCDVLNNLTGEENGLLEDIYNWLREPSTAKESLDAFAWAQVELPSCEETMKWISSEANNCDAVGMAMECIVQEVEQGASANNTSHWMRAPK